METSAFSQERTCRSSPLTSESDPKATLATDRLRRQRLVLSRPSVALIRGQMPVPSRHRGAGRVRHTRRAFGVLYGQANRGSGLVVKPVAKVLPGLEERNEFPQYDDRLAGARVPPDALGPRFDRKGTKAAQLNPVAVGKPRRNFVKYCRNDPFHVALG